MFMLALLSVSPFPFSSISPFPFFTFFCPPPSLSFSHPPPFPFRRCVIFSLKRQYVVTVPHLLGPTVLANNVGPKLILSFGALSFLCHTDNCQNSDDVMQDWRKGRLVKRRAAPRLGNHLLCPTLYSVDFTLRRITCHYHHWQLYCTTTGSGHSASGGSHPKPHYQSDPLSISGLSDSVVFFFYGIFEFLALFSLSYIDSIAVSLFTKGEQEGDAI